MRIKKLVIPYKNEYLTGMLFTPNSLSQSYPVVCKIHGLVTQDFSKEEFLAKLLTEKGIAYSVIHLTGFFNSPGESSLHEAFGNLDEIISFIAHQRNIDPFRIGLFGVSLGGALAICHASRDPRISALALHAPVHDLSFMKDYPHFDAMLDGLISMGKFRTTVEKIKMELYKDIRGNEPLKQVTRISPRPLLILASEKDELIPIRGIKELYKNAFNPKQFKIIEQADHHLSMFTKRKQAYLAIQDFFVKQFIA
jgi:hypothetical protein